MCDKRWVQGLDGKNDSETALNVRRFMLLLETPGFGTIKESMQSFHRLLYKALNPSPAVAETFIRWVTEYDKERFQRLVTALRNDLAQHV